VDNLQWRWIDEYLPQELAEHTGSEALRAEGASMQRRDVMNLVRELEIRLS